MREPSTSWFPAVAILLLLLNTAYIAAVAAPTVFYMSNVLLHVAGGGVLWVAALVWWRRARVEDRSWSGSASVLALTVAAALAGVLIWRGNLAEHRSVLVAHAVAGGIAVVALLPLAGRLAAGLDGVIRPIEGGIRTVAHQLEEVDPPRREYAPRIRGILAAWPDVYGSTIAVAGGEENAGGVFTGEFFVVDGVTDAATGDVVETVRTAGPDASALRRSDGEGAEVFPLARPGDD